MAMNASAAHCRTRPTSLKISGSSRSLIPLNIQTGSLTRRSPGSRSSVSSLALATSLQDICPGRSGAMHSALSCA
jgi:hypothetical protein